MVQKKLLNKRVQQPFGIMDSNTRVNGTGALLVLLGIIVILVPWIIFPVCEIGGLYVQAVSGMQFPMPSGWTARAESGIGALIVVTGGLLLARNTPETRQAAGVLLLPWVHS
jgi:hypothetical protein